jgi:dTDP-4-amino-4,6-dideoxygalactose transaminase
LPPADQPGWEVPFNRPAVTGREIEYLREALQSHRISGDRDFTRRCHALLRELTTSPRPFLTTSCTHALEMAMLLANLAPSDEVICPAFTFVSAANAIALRGARVVFVDVRRDTMNVDEELIEAAITPRTRAMIVMHYAGVGCEMDRILEIARRHGLMVVEDNAHGLFGRFRGRPLGTFGALATLSFHETKNITCGEGGALLVNDERLVERAEIIREKGTNRARFFRGDVDRYTWSDLGSSYLPSDLLAACLLAQLEAAETIQQKRHQIWNTYSTELAPWAERVGARLPVIPEHCDHPAHLFYLLMPSLGVRTAFIEHLRQRGIMAIFHYQPLHLSEMGRRVGGAAGQCPVTEDIADRLVRLPLFFHMEGRQQEKVIESVREFRTE